MKHFKQKAKLMSLLGTILAVMLLTGCNKDDGETKITGSGIDPTNQRYQFRTVIQDTEAWDGNDTYGFEYYPYDGHLLQQQNSETAGLTFADVTSNDIRLQFDFDYMQFAEGDLIANLYLDSEGTLWWLLRDISGEYRVAQMQQGKTMENICTLKGYPFTYAACRFAVSDGVAILSEENILVLYDLKNGSQIDMINGAHIFCVDANGWLYYFSGEDSLLVKRSLHQSQVAWQESVDSSEKMNIQQMFYHPDMGLFTMASGSGQIDCRDNESGIVRYTLFSTAENSNVDYSNEALFFNSAFAVDQNYCVWLSCVSTDYTSTPFTYTRHMWAFEPFLPDIDSSEVVSLTITAPYKVRAVESSIRMYQREHPEVEVIWDVQYNSRDELILHGTQYAEQLALRLMTGDVGDILMLHGSGLDVDAILKTDVMADLSSYLEDCPFRDELEESPLDALQDESGALRALPVALRPRYMIYNETLAQKMHLDWNAEDLTWAQMLTLAKKWQEDDVPISLLWSDTVDAQSGKDILRDILLANLDAFSTSDGSVNIGQPWLRDMVQQVKALQGSRSLKSSCRDFWWSEGSLSDTLFVRYYGADYTNLFNWLRTAEENNNITLRIVPMPRGEHTMARQSYAYCWGIPTVSKQKDMAWDLLSFMVSSDGFVTDTYTDETCLLNKKADKERFELSIRSTAIYDENGIILAGDELRLYEDYRASLAQPISRMTEPLQWREAIYVPIEQYLQEMLTLDEAIGKAEEAWQRVLTAQQ